MCGRFTLTVPDFEELTKLLGVAYDARLAARYRRRYNVAPSDAHWIVAAPGEERAILPARWGFGAKKLPLARGESVAKQNLFKGAFEQRRCVVPADGFFEWTGEKGDRRPHWFHPRAADDLLLLAGVYGEGPHGFDFAIVTTDANATVRAVHDRMPVVIPKGEIDRWLRGAPSEAAQLVAPAPDDMLIDTEVSKRVNSALHDDAACLDAATADDAPKSSKQGKLFG